jgi:acetyl esterase
MTRYVHPEAQAMIERAARSTERIELLTPAEARAASDTRVANAPLPKRALPEVRDIVMPGPAGELRLRLYRPEGDGPLPYCMYFHGGGFMLGTLDTHDALCRQLASRSGVALVAVEFRLAPENPAPAGSDDCLAATRWVHAHAAELGLDSTRFAVGGESSGGNLAAGVAIRLRDGGPRPRMQLLLYPLVDMSLAHESYQTLGVGYLLTTARSAFYVRNYLGPAGDVANPVNSPLRDPAPNQTPTTFLLTATLDPSMGDALDYGARLQTAGVEVEEVRFEGWTHGFLFWGHEDGSIAALTRAAAALRRGLA